MRLLTLALLAATAVPALAQQGAKAFRIPVGRVITGEGEIAPAAIIVRASDGQLLALGKPEAVEAGEGVWDMASLAERFARNPQVAARFKALIASLTVTPLTVDGNTQRGADGTLREGALSPGLSAADGLDPLVPGWTEAARAGVGASVFAPDSGAALSGVAILLTPGKRLLDVGLRREVALFGGVDARSWSNGGRPPATRGAVVAAIVQMFRDAKQGHLDPDPDDYRTWRPDAAVLKRVLAGELALALRVGTAGDIRAALQVFAQLKLTGAIVGGNGAMTEPGVIEAIAAAKARVVLDPLTPAQTGRALSVPAALQRAGVPFCFSSRAPATLESSLSDQAALAVMHGLPADAAWAALTTGPSRVYQLRYTPTLKTGASGLAIYRGDPRQFSAPRAGLFPAGAPVTLRQIQSLLR